MSPGARGAARRPLDSTSSLLPFVLGSLVLHVGLMVGLPAWTEHTPPHAALASQERVVRLVLPKTRPEPRPVEPLPELPEPVPPPEPDPLPEPEPQPEAPPPPEPVSAPVPLPTEPPPPPPVLPPVETPERLPSPADELPPPVSDTPPPPAPLPDEPPPEDLEEPEERLPEADPAPEEEAPREGEADQDRAALEVEAVPDPTRTPRPDYPRRARVRGWEGTVVLEVVVSPSGRATRVEVFESSGYDILDEAALETVLTWRFVPGTRAGRPCESTVRVPVTFRLVDR